MQVTASIFKAYDIRGIVPSTINEAMAEALGKAFGSTALAEGEKTVAVGRDGRLSGPTLAAALIRGLVAAGVEVIDTGVHLGQTNVVFDEEFLDLEKVAVFKSNTNKLLHSFCTEQFKKLYEDNDFKGLVFEPVEVK